MLKGISPLLSPELLKVLCEMGHGDELVIADGNFPAESIGKNAVVGQDASGAAPDQMPPVTVVGSECHVPDNETIEPGQMLGKDVYPKKEESAQ